MYSIYCITNTINGKKYIGMTSMSVRKRWRLHISHSKHEHGGMYNSPLQADIRKYGESCFVHQVLTTTEDKELAMQLEDEMTITLNTLIPNGYNRIIGCHFDRKSENRSGDNNPMWGKHHSEETKRKISESNKGENHHMYGKHHSEEHKKRMSLKFSKPVMCVETGVIFMNLTEASKWAGLKSNASISQCCTGKRKTAGGYHWEYVLKDEY